MGEIEQEKFAYLIHSSAHYPATASDNSSTSTTEKSSSTSNDFSPSKTSPTSNVKGQKK
jgi:hypothetical protein